MKFIAIDFETANEMRSSPCAMGLAWIEHGQVTRREYRLMRPKELRFGYYESRVHGLSEIDVVGAPEFPDVIAEFLPDIAGCILFAHNARFDVEVLSATLTAYGMAVPQFSYLCSLELARKTWAGRKKYSLAAVGESLDISFQHHHAGEDAHVCAQIVLAAAREANVTDLALLSDHLSLLHRRVDHLGWIDPTSRRLPATSLRGGGHRYLRLHAEHAAISLPQGILFTVSGSEDKIYKIVETTQHGSFDLKCECMGWRSRKHCKHVRALIFGDVEHLRTESPGAFDVLAQKLRKFGIPKIYAAWDPFASKPVG